jgi:hypothetical protein
MCYIYIFYQHLILFERFLTYLQIFTKQKLSTVFCLTSKFYCATLVYMDQKDYNRIMGLDTEDVGSRKKLLNKVLVYSKKKSYPQADFYKMKKKQLQGIFYSKCL